MSVFVPVSNGLQVTYQFQDATGDINENVFWVQRSGAWSVSLVTAMLEAMANWFANGDGTHSYQKIMSSSCSLVAMAGRDFTTQHGISIINQVGLPAAGTGASTAIAAGTTKALTHRTGLAGKSYRGRTFLCGIDSGAVPVPDSGEILASFMTNAVAAFTALIGVPPAADAEATLVVCSRYYQPGGPGTPTVPRSAGVTTPITSFGYSTLNVDFQRRRAPGHARHH